jgi:catechol 2,3-dioxygenase-like lactoylglutathione lyase family enzyme
VARLVGINHVALEVGDLDDAVRFYGQVFDFELRGRAPRMAFLDMGDQFLALVETAEAGRDGERHLGLVVDDRADARRRLERAGADVVPGRGCSFHDPWGNLIELVQYSEIQFTKAPEVLGGMGLGGLGKSAAALDELRQKGLAP